MTKKELQQIYYLTKEKEEVIEELKELQARVLSSRGLSYGIRGKGGHSDRTMDIAINIARKKEIIESYEEAILLRRIEIERWLQTIDNLRLRLIIHYRFVKLMTFEEIAKKVSKTESERTARQYMDRLLPEYLED